MPEDQKDSTLTAPHAEKKCEESTATTSEKSAPPAPEDSKVPPQLRGKEFGAKGAISPREAQRRGVKAWKEGHSIRAAAKILSRYTLEELEEVSKKKRTMTAAQAVALAKFNAAIKGNVKAMQQITDDIDGKQVEKRVEVTMSLEDLVMGAQTAEPEVLITGEDYDDAGDDEGSTLEG